MGGSSPGSRNAIALAALAGARDELRRVWHALENVGDWLQASSTVDVTAASLAVEELRIARRQAELALREAQELTDCVIDDLASNAPAGERPITGVVSKNRSAWPPGDASPDIETKYRSPSCSIHVATVVRGLPDRRPRTSIFGLIQRVIVSSSDRKKGSPRWGSTGTLITCSRLSPLRFSV